MRLGSLAPLFAGALLLLATGEAVAQGKSNDPKSRDVAASARDHKGDGRAKKRVVTVDHAVVVTREVLVRHGFEVVRVERVGGVQVVYYRRGNMGRGKGKGPLQKIVIRPTREIVVIESAPRGVQVDINIRLGL